MLIKFLDPAMHDTVFGGCWISVVKSIFTPFAYFLVYQIRPSVQNIITRSVQWWIGFVRRQQIFPLQYISLSSSSCPRKKECWISNCRNDCVPPIARNFRLEHSISSFFFKFLSGTYFSNWMFREAYRVSVRYCCDYAVNNRIEATQPNNDTRRWLISQNGKYDCTCFFVLLNRDFFFCYLHW